MKDESLGTKTLVPKLQLAARVNQTTVHALPNSSEASLDAHEERKGSRSLGVIFGGQANFHFLIQTLLKSNLDLILT